MANVQEILSDIDDGLNHYLPIISQKQENYYKQNQRYAQALFTHSSPPIDENMDSPDQLGLKPTDRDETWSDLAGEIIPDTMLSRVRIDTYYSKEGHGYVVVLEKIINGELYRKGHNVGPESYKSYDWTIIIEE